MENQVTRADFMLLIAIILSMEAHNMGIVDDEVYKTFLTMNLDTIQKYVDMMKGVNKL